MKKLLMAAVLLLSSALALAAVNLNTATQAELETLSGIGPVKANHRPATNAKKPDAAADAKKEAPKK